MPLSVTSPNGSPTGLRARVALGAVDALVRSATSAPATAAQVAQRAIGALRDVEEMAVEIEPLALRLGGQLLGGEASPLKWTLPVFLAGVRSFRLTDGDADDLLQLAERFAATTATMASAQLLQDWVFCDGASGFAVDLAPSFVETFEASESASLASTSAILAIRAQAIRDDSEASLPVRELDQAASLATLSVDVDLYEKRVSGRELEISGRDLVRLGEEADAKREWLDLELALATGPSQEAARAIGPRRLGRLLRARLAHGVDEPFLDAWTAAAGLAEGAPRTAGSSLVRARLHHPGFFSEVGTRLVPSAAARALALVTSIGAVEAASVLVAHLERDDEPLPEVRSWLVSRIGAADSLVGIARTPRALARSVACLDAASESTRRALLLAAPEEAMVAALLALGDARLARLVHEARDRFAASSIEALLRLALDLGATDDLLVWLGGRHAGALPRALVDRAARHLVQEGRGAHVVELARSRGAREPVRIAALHAAYRAPALRASVLAFRLGELIDPGELAYELRALRRAAKGARA